MNAQDFVEVVKTAVYGGAVKGTLDVLQRPPGRCPDASLIELNQWFSRLGAEDHRKLIQVIELAADQASYNFLLVLDGLLAVEPAGKKGELELSYSDGITRTRLNSENAVELSSLFKAHPKAGVSAPRA